MVVVPQCVAGQEVGTRALIYRAKRRNRLGFSAPGGRLAHTITLVWRLAGAGRSSPIPIVAPSSGEHPMNRKDALSNLRQVLIKRRDALRKALAGDLSLLKELHEQTSGDMIDAALDSVQDEISSQLAEVESRELARIEVALERMRIGQYGICEICGCNIPMARLNALPYATNCIKCQREAEREGGAFGADADWSRLLDSQGNDADLSINDIEIDVS